MSSVVLQKNKRKPVDKFFLGIVITLLIIGIFSFVSASFGVLAKDPSKFYGILLNQIVFGLGLGSLFMFLFSRVDYSNWKKYSFYLFFLSVVSLALVFIPGLGFSHGGATRWLDLGPFSFQPVELFKIGFVIYFSAWLGWSEGKWDKMKKAIIPFSILFFVGVFLLINQPDTKSLILIFISGLGISFVGGLKWKHILGILAVVLIGLSLVAIKQPYLLTRIKTFINPAHDPQGASWQLRQSLMAIGSGGIFGRGFGQSIQKFSYLPEPQGDSIFAVIGEEFGILGSFVVVFLFLAFSLRGLYISVRAPDKFGTLLVAGLVILISAQSFMNIASITGLFPLTGVPLVFMSQGGTSLFISMAVTGIILNVSRRIN